MRLPDRLGRIAAVLVWPASCVVMVVVLRGDGELLKTWAWPAVVIASVAMLRKEVGGLIGRLEGFSGPVGLKAEFRKSAESLNSLTSDLVPDTPDKIAVPTKVLDSPPSKSNRSGAFIETIETLDDLLAEVRVEARRGIFHSWQLLERITFRESYENKTSFTPELLIAMLISQGAIDPEFGKVAAALRFAKDAAQMWNVSIDPQDAERLVRSAWRLAATMEEALRNPGLEFPPMLSNGPEERSIIALGMSAE